MIDRFSWIAIYPEIVLLVMACVIALTDLLDIFRGNGNTLQPNGLPLLSRPDDCPARGHDGA